MAEYRYSISIRISHPSLDLAHVSNALILEPNAIWKAGEPRTTPKGSPLPGINKINFWTARLIDDVSEHRSLGDAISDALNMTAKASSLLMDIATSGGEVEFFVGWFFDNGNSGDVLDHNLLGRLAARRINLSFDVYP
jgi:hypothetical protein